MVWSSDQEWAVWTGVVFWSAGVRVGELLDFAVDDLCRGLSSNSLFAKPFFFFFFLFFFFFFLFLLFTYLLTKTISLTNNRFKLQRVQYTISRILPLQRALVSGKEQILVGFWGFTRWSWRARQWLCRRIWAIWQFHCGSSWSPRSMALDPGLFIIFGVKGIS
jgi:hypothetical protein